MPGTYAHITLVNELTAPMRIDLLKGMPKAAKKAVGMNFKYCELGAVSPDYPYLNLLSDGAKKWADLMHYSSTGDVIREGVRKLQGSQCVGFDKKLSWLLGYVSHVVADCTIHPVVELRVGDYDHHKDEHRICEMNQDAHIYQRLNLGSEIGLSEHLDSGIASCVGSGTRGELDVDLQSYWQDILETVYPAESTKNPPKINKWHEWFVDTLDIAEEGNRLPVFARHLISDKGITYPSSNALDNTHLCALNTPAGKMSYDQVFDLAIENAGKIWEAVASAVCNNDEKKLSCLANWNLDTGKNENDRYGFWS